MWAFTLCLIAAGAILSLFARLPLLLAMLFGIVLATLGAGALSGLGFEIASSTPINIIVAIAALQVGYGSGIITRAALHRFFSHAALQGAARTRTATDPTGRRAP
jgi:hypothetical protein